MSQTQIYKTILTAMQKRMAKIRKAFKNGDLILVGDDGQRENEVDLVFHASAATQQKVNFAITHAKGLLCVSLSHDLADKFGLSAAPKFPGNILHTNFTLSVDARDNITTGISAADRAHTILLMSQQTTTPQHFITPGHVFPLRAMHGGLLTRPGHTEALYELCHMEKLPCSAALCEVLGPDGSTLNSKFFLENLPKNSVFAEIPFVSTVDILWSKILFEQSQEAQFVQEKNFLVTNAKTPLATFILHPGLEEKITLPTVICIYSKQFSPENLRISITNSISTWDNGIPQSSCCAEISLFNFKNCLEELPVSIADFCDLSAKEGLKETKGSVRRMLSELRALQFIYKYFKLKELSLGAIRFLTPSDKEFLHELLVQIT